MQIWEALLRMSAASTYLNLGTTDESRKSSEHRVEDQRNPVFKISREAQSIWAPSKLKIEVICLLSIGSGLSFFGTFTHKFPRIDLSLSNDFSLNMHQLDERYYVTNKSAHHRFNVTSILEEIGLQKGLSKHASTTATDRYIDSQSVFEKMKACGQKLSERSSIHSPISR